MPDMVVSFTMLQQSNNTISTISSTTLLRCSQSSSVFLGTVLFGNILKTFLPPHFFHYFWLSAPGGTFIDKAQLGLL